MKTYTAEDIVAKFQYSFVCTEETITLDEGFSIEIVRDDYPENPHDAATVKPRQCGCRLVLGCVNTTMI